MHTVWFSLATGVTEAQLARLAVEGIGETKTLEYKQALTFVTDEQKRELLSDLAALANTDGGDLVFGMAAEKGVATELIGLKNFVADEAIGRIENLLRDFVQPRIAGVVFRVLPLVNGNQVLLIRVPRSFSSPHMIRHHGVTRFCGRNANGKYDLDVHELRSAFLASETFSDRLKAFRLERINRLLSGNGPVPLAGEHVLVMHILPVIGAGTNAVVSTSDLQRVHGEAGLRPPASRGWNHSFNSDPEEDHERPEQPVTNADTGPECLPDELLAHRLVDDPEQVLALELFDGGCVSRVVAKPLPRRAVAFQRKVG